MNVTLSLGRLQLDAFRAAGIPGITNIKNIPLKQIMELIKLNQHIYTISSTHYKEDGIPSEPPFLVGLVDRDKLTPVFLQNLIKNGMSFRVSEIDNNYLQIVTEYGRLSEMPIIKLTINEHMSYIKHLLYEKKIVLFQVMHPLLFYPLNEMLNRFI